MKKNIIPLCALAALVSVSCFGFIGCSSSKDSDASGPDAKLQSTPKNYKFMTDTEQKAKRQARAIKNGEVN
jgi:hypothetical protein